ncbi:MAG: thiamine pyrophosphate-binding protein [Thaumarchaeota archaeon]|nr:thiamine pyrophosphate-binding protein [Nitrososphaerota archaeon]
MLGSESLVASLKAEGVRYVAGIPADGVVEILDAMYDSDDIDFLLVRHEQSAAHLADAYSRVSRAPKCVCLTSRAAGATNTAIGMASAYHCGSPLVSITTQVNSKTIGRFAFEEVDLVELFRPLSKWSAQVNRPERIPEFVRAAFRHAMAGAPGPAHLAVPSDYLKEQIDAEIYQPSRYRTTSAARPLAEKLQEAVKILSKASSPVIIAGDGVNWSNAQGQLVKLAELLGAPVVTAWFRKDAFPEDHVLSAGMMGLGGVDTSREVIKEADAVLVMGCELSDLSTDRYKMRFAPDAKVIQVDIDPYVIGKMYQVDVPMVADCGETLKEMIPQLQKTAAGPRVLERRPNVKSLLRHKEEWKAKVAIRNPDGIPIEPGRVVKEMRQFLKRDAIITIDSGNFSYWTVPFFDAYLPGTYICSGGFMGFALPGAIGAKLARPGAQVVGFVGDGGFMMTLQELETATRLKTPVVMVVMNDFQMANIKVRQTHLYSGRYIGVDVTNPDFAKLAETFNCYGERVERPEDIRPALGRAFRDGRPAVLDVIINPKTEHKSIVEPWWT